MTVNNRNSCDESYYSGVVNCAAACASLVSKLLLHGLPCWSLGAELKHMGPLYPIYPLI